MAYMSHISEIDSNILDDDKQSQLKDALKKHKIMEVDEQRPPRIMKLIYRGSENGFKSDTFYEKCGGKDNVFCVIQSEEDNIFGGYTAKGWDTLNSNEDATKYNQDLKAFLFCFKSYPTKELQTDNDDDSDYSDDSADIYHDEWMSSPVLMDGDSDKFETIDKLETFPIRSKQDSKYSTVSIPETMCGFGENGQDICISNLCNNNNESWISFDEYGSSFNTPSNSYLNNGDNWFKVKEIEIFQII